VAMTSAFSKNAYQRVKIKQDLPFETQHCKVYEEGQYEKEV
jgi:hypothetical protein